MNNLSVGYNLAKISQMSIKLFSLIILLSWLKISQEGIEIYYQPSMKRFAQIISRQAPSAKKLLESELGFKFSQTIGIVISQSEQEFEHIQLGAVPEWAVATADPEHNIIYLQPLARTSIADFAKIFRHELAHLFIRKRLSGRVAPRWFEEGLAMIFSGEFGFERFTTLASIGLSGKYLPFERLDSAFPSSGAQARIAYLESMSFVGFIMDELGEDGFQRLLDELALGKNFYTALYKLSGLPFDELVKKWLKELKYHYGLIFALFSSGSLWFLVSLLFILAYLKKRREALLKKKILELEDQYYGGELWH